MTMHQPETGNKPARKPDSDTRNSAAKKRRKKRARGVPTALTAALIIISLFFGGLVGYVVANRTNTYRADLASAQERITALENTLTMMGFSESENNADEWVFDDTDISDEIMDLSGGSDDAGDAFWSESGLLSGEIKLDGEPVVVAEFDGGTVLSSEVVDPYNDALAMQVFNYGDADAVSGDVLDQVLRELVAEKVLYLRAQELGLTELSEADLADIEANAEAYYQDQRAFYSSSVDTTGMTEEEASAAIDDYLLNDVGISVEGLIDEEKASFWIQKLYNHVTKDVAVSDEAITAAYDELLAAQQELFADSDEYEYAAMIGDPITYNLEGYRRIKHILLSFESSDAANQAYDLMASIAQLNPETDMDQITGLQTQLDALYADLDAAAESIIAELNAGADFDALIEQYGDDEAMMFEPTKSMGYYVSADSTQWDPAFLEGCMMLEEPGQVSTPVHSVSGVHIIQYVADIQPGSVPVDSVRDAIAELLLADLQETAYEDQINAWLSDVNAKYYPEKLQ